MIKLKLNSLFMSKRRSKKNIVERAFKVFLALLFILIILGFETRGTKGFKDVINNYSVWHFLVGVSAGLLLVKPKWAVTGIVMWEIVEQLLLVPFGFCYPPELVVDSVIDIILALMGYLVAGYLLRKESVFDDIV